MREGRPCGCDRCAAAIGTRRDGIVESLLGNRRTGTRGPGPAVRSISFCCCCCCCCCCCFCSVAITVSARVPKLVAAERYGFFMILGEVRASGERLGVAGSEFSRSSRRGRLNAQYVTFLSHEPLLTTAGLRQALGRRAA